MSERISGLQIFGGLAVSALFLGGLIWWAEPTEIWSALSKARLGPLAAAAGCYLVVLAARWVRLVGLIDGETLSSHRLELLWASAGHSFANQLLPARTGEFVFPALWHRATGEGYAEGALYLAAIRVVELGLVISMFGVGLMAWWGGGWAVALLGIGLLAALPLLLQLGLRLLSWAFCDTWLSEIGWLKPLRKGIPNARSAMEGLGRGRRLWLVVTSAVMWVAMFGVFWCCLAACGLELGVAQTVVGSTGGIVGNLVPVGTIGSLGAMEAGWTAGFQATGAPAGPVVAASLVVRALVFLGTGLVTALAVIIDGLKMNFIFTKSPECGG
jgi:uncharacterized membrane protein YbhN (UPF0104 family)